MILTAALVATNVYSDFSLGKAYVMKQRCGSQPIVREVVAHFLETIVYFLRLVSLFGLFNQQKNKIHHVSYEQLIHSLREGIEPRGQTQTRSHISLRMGYLFSVTL